MELTEFTPVKRETIATIRARMDADINAGIPPTDDRFVDTTPGGWYWDLTQVGALEIERLYDYCAIELPASMFLAYAFGDYLDEWGVNLNRARKAAAKATGTITLSGDVGTVVAAGAQVAVVQQDPNAAEVAFETTQDTTLAEVPAPTGLAASQVSSGGSLAVGSWFYAVTAVKADGFETIPSAEVNIATVTAVSKVTLTWGAVSGAIGYIVYRGTKSGVWYHLMTLGVVLTYVDDGTAPLGTMRPPTNTVPIQALTPGEFGNVAIATISELLSPVPGITAVTNDVAASGGADTESDEAYSNRLLEELGAPVGGGTIADYVNWCLSHPSVGYVTVNPLWAGAGTVEPVVTDSDNNPVSSTVLAELQTMLDPVAQQGRGLAPIGALVTVATPTGVVVNVAATLVLDAGYSYDGLEGYIAVRQPVIDAANAYINALPPGQNVIYDKVLASLFSIVGVHDCTALTLNGGSANVAMSSSQVAEAGTVTLS